MIRVLVVDDSEICRELLRDQLEEEGDIEVAGTAATGEEALAVLPRVKPDVVTVDLEMPGMGGMSLIEEIMATDPRPIIVVTGLDARERDLAVAATERGALQLANKAGPGDHEASAALRESVRRLAVIEVGTVERPRERTPKQVQWPKGREAVGTPIVAFGSSAGGPTALFEILDALPPNLPACIAVAQHLPADFVSAFARLLRSRIHFEVLVATEPVAPDPTQVVLAPGGCDLIYEGGLLVGRPTGPGAMATPEIDVLFGSLADHGGRHVGVVLSGLGDDGSRGLARMRREDQLTVVQDRASATVWGMPRAAQASALEVLPTREIAGAITRWLSNAARGGSS